MNIFQISRDLLDTFQEIEDNGGELTEELESQLAISQADFKTKVEGYANVIKSAQYDIKSIDEEIDRLRKLKESKNKAIVRLEKILIWAIEMFGDTNKSGNKYVDYGTGKISIRNTEKVEVDDAFAEDTVEKFMAGLRELGFTKELYYDELEAFIPKSDDINGVSANISFDIPLDKLYTPEGYNVIKSLFEYNTDFKYKPSISKSYLKSFLKDNPDAYPNLAHLVKNQTITIK